MIAYDLRCQNGHTFEGWFKDAEEFKKQQCSGLIACPVCEDTAIARIPSTFAIKGTPAQAPVPQQNVNVDPRTVLQAMQQFVDKHFDNVGTEFAKEALKIHYGVGEPRNIRGVSTPKEEETLRKEGVEFFKFPLPPDEPPPSADS